MVAALLTVPDDSPSGLPRGVYPLGLYNVDAKGDLIRVEYLIAGVRPMKVYEEFVSLSAGEILERDDGEALWDADD